MHENPHAHFPEHDSVIRPLLYTAESCYVYGIAQGSDVQKAAGNILTKVNGKHSVRLDRDSIAGHEYFWNASGGKRGSVVFLVAIHTFAPAVIFPHCHSP